MENNLSAIPEATPIEQRELVLTRILKVPRASAYRAWTEPELVKKWFAPLPWTTPHAEMDVRAGGSNRRKNRS